VLIVRAIKKLLTRLRSPTLQDGEHSTTLLGQWYATALPWRPQVAMLVNEPTLLPVLMPLAPAATLLARVPRQIATVLAAHGTPQPIIDDELQRMREHRVSGTANRSVVGIMNEFTFLATTLRDNHGRPDLLELSLRLATTPCSPLYRRNISPDLDGLPPRPLLDGDVGEAGRGQPGRQVERPEPIGQPILGRVDRFPAGQHYPSPGCQDPADLLVHRLRGEGELDGVDAHDGIDRRISQSGSGQITHLEHRHPAQPVSVLLRLPYRLGREVHSDQVRPVSVGHLQTIATASTRQIQDHPLRGQPQRRADLGDRVPGEQTRGQQVRGQAEAATHELVPAWRRGHVRVRLVEILGGWQCPGSHP
jgi:hypothetical protein